MLLRLTTVATDISEYSKIWKLLPRGRRKIETAASPIVKYSSQCPVKYRVARQKNSTTNYFYPLASALGTIDL
jgi:hypothetical protein